MNFLNTLPSENNIGFNLSKEIEEEFKLLLKHALFGNRDSLMMVLNRLPGNIRDYLLLNLTLFSNSLVDLLSKIKSNTHGLALVIKDVENTNDPINKIKIIDNNIFLKSNYIVDFSNNMMINPIANNLQLEKYNKLIEVLLTFYYNNNWFAQLKENKAIYAKVNCDQTSMVLRNMMGIPFDNF